MCIHLIICIWECPRKCVCMWASELLCVSLDGSPYSCTTICASVNVAVQRCLPLRLHVPLSPCTRSCWPCVLLCSPCVSRSFSLMSAHSFCTPVPHVCTYVSLCRWTHLCVVHAHPCEHCSWYVWDLWAHTCGCPVSVFMSVCVFGQYKYILSILSPGGYLCVHLHRILCPACVQAARLQIHFCGTLCVMAL